MNQGSGVIIALLGDEKVVAMIDVIEPLQLYASCDGGAFDSVLRLSIEAFSADVVSLYRENDRGDFVCIAHGQKSELVLSKPPDVLAASELAQLLRSQSGIMVAIDSDAYGDILVRQGALTYHLELMLGGSILLEEGESFAMCLGFRTKINVSDAVKARFQLLLKQAKTMLCLAVEKEHVKRLKEEHVVLSDIQNEVSKLQDLDATLSMIVRKTCDLLNADASYIALADESRRVLTISHTYGCFTKQMQSGFEQGYGTGGIGVVAATLEPVFVEDFAHFDQFENDPLLDKALEQEHVMCAMAVPMIASGKLVGTLSALSRRPRAFERDALSILQRLATSAAIAIENARWHDRQLETIVRSDAMTNANKLFLELSIQNAGMQVIAETISMLTELDVLVEDDTGAFLAKVVEASLKGGQLSAHELLSAPDMFPFLSRLSHDRHPVFVPEEGGSSQEAWRLIVPVQVGDALLGSISFLGVQPGEELPKAIIDLVSIAVALEFKKREAAETVLLQRSLNAQENERVRIARELHDETSQSIVALTFGLETAMLSLKSDPSQAEGKIEDCKQIADHLLMGIRHAISDLRPAALADQGLACSLREYAEQRLEPLGIVFELEGDIDAMAGDPLRELALFRIVQEALSNVAKHSGATTAAVSASVVDEDLVLTTADNGQGFNP